MQTISDRRQKAIRIMLFVAVTVVQVMCKCGNEGMVALPQSFANFTSA